ncbi:hypothetical protein ACFXAM_17135, partial [Kitasatospora sp. NPDC059462]
APVPAPASGAAHAPSAAASAPPAGAAAGAAADTICDQAERFGRWAAGSEQARLCRSIYG